MLAPLILFVVLSFLNVSISLILLLCVPLIPLSIVAVQKFAKKLLSRYWGQYTGLGDSFKENVEGLTTLKIYQADAMKEASMVQEAETFRKITMKVLTMQLNSISVMDIVAYGGAGLGMIFTIFAYQQGTLTLGNAIVFILLAAEFFIPLRLLGSYFHIAMNGMAASDRIFAFLDLPEDDTAKIPVQHVSPIVFQNVHFAYEVDRPILQEITLQFPQTGLVGLVGVSGSGKSTIAKLMAGENKGYTGSIQIGGIELSSIEESSLKQNIVMIRHNSYLFQGTVREHLRQANANASEDSMWQMLEQVQLKAFLQNQQGLDTKLHEGGSNLSGGQRQRLALARALLADAPIYIFDEATSNIDMESEECIMQVVHALAQTKLVLCISHRLQNVVPACTIFMLEAGQLMEQGTHAELLEMYGAYCALYQQQQSLERYGMQAPQKANEEGKA